MSLSAKLFGEGHTKYFSQVIPGEYPPWNVSKRVHNSVGLTTGSIYEEAIKIYELALLQPLSKTRH